MTLELNEDRNKKELNDGEVLIMTSEDGLTNVFGHGVGAIKSRVHVINNNSTGVDLLPNEVPTNVNMACTTRGSVVMAKIDGTSIITIKSHRKMEFKSKFFNDVFDEKHLTDTHQKSNIFCFSA